MKNNLITKFLGILIVFFLSACSTPAEDKAKMQKMCENYKKKHGIDLCDGDYRYKTGKNIEIFLDNESVNTEGFTSGLNEMSIDFECYNICKQSVKGGLTISQLDKFCKLQCPLN